MHRGNNVLFKFQSLPLCCNLIKKTQHLLMFFTLKVHLWSSRVAKWLQHMQHKSSILGLSLEGELCCMSCPFSRIVKIVVWVFYLRNLKPVTHHAVGQCWRVGEHLFFGVSCSFGSSWTPVSSFLANLLCWIMLNWQWRKNPLTGCVIGNFLSDTFSIRLVINPLRWAEV